MIAIKKIIIFITFLNLYFCLINIDKKEDDSQKTSLPKKHLTFDEFDKIMLNSEYGKAWENFKETRKPEPILDEPFDIVYSNNQLKDKILTEDNNDTDSCLLSKEKTIEILKGIDKNYNDNNPSDEIRFIFGNCNPIILIPGMLSTKLQIKVKCKNLLNKEVDIFKKMRFYCGEYICPIEDSEEEEYNFFH